MGLAESSLAQPGTDLVVEPMSACPRGGMGVDREKPPDLAVDDALWSELVRCIDPLARDLNRGMAVVSVLFVVTIVADLIVSWSFDMPAKLYVIIPVSLVLLSTLMLITSYILNVKNGAVDRQVEEVLKEMRPRFEAAGYRAGYKTQHTGVFTAKKSERVISFIRISGCSPP